MEYLKAIAVPLIKAPFDNVGTTFHSDTSSNIDAAVIFSPSLLTNKIVIIEEITLCCEAIFKSAYEIFFLLEQVQLAAHPKDYSV